MNKPTDLETTGAKTPLLNSDLLNNEEVEYDGTLESLLLIQKKWSEHEGFLSIHDGMWHVFPERCSVTGEAPWPDLPYV